MNLYQNICIKIVLSHSLLTSEEIEEILQFSSLSKDNQIWVKKFGQARVKYFLVNLNNVTFGYLLCPMILQNCTKLI